MTMLETGGDPIDLRAHDRFLQAIAEYFGAGHSALFAIPSLHAGDGTLTWTTTLSGPVVRFEALDAAKRQNLLQQITQTYADIDRVAATQGSPLSPDYAQMLRFPNTSALWLVGNQPVISRWGLPGLPDNGLISLPVRTPLSNAAIPLLRQAPHLVPSALIGAGAGLLAATLLCWKLSHLFSPACSLPTGHAAPLPPLPPTTSTTGADDVRRAHDAGGRSGKLEIILTWQDKNDLDLHVIPPSEERIYFNHRTADGGYLDLDANQATSSTALMASGLFARALAGAEQFLGGKIIPSSIGNTNHLTNHPVEHVTWENDPPLGRYTVQINPYAMPYADTSPYHVTIFYNGKEILSRSGTATQGHTIEVSPAETTIAEFNIPN